MEENQNMQNNRITTAKTRGQKIATSTTFRMVVIGALTLILMIPMSFVNSLVRDRMRLKDSVIREINASWGKSVEISGPTLEVPIKTYRTEVSFTSDGKRTENIIFEGYKYLYVFPDKLNIEGEILGEPKKIGIYQSAVYRAKTTITGNFSKPDFKKLTIKEENIDWKKAKIRFSTTNNKGITDKMNFKWEDKEMSFSLQGSKYEMRTFETEQLSGSPFSEKNSVAFSMNYNVKGSKSFNIIPIGNETTVHLTSNWKESKFDGQFLPDNKDKINEKGFDAHWKIIDYQRSFSQYHYDKIPNYSDYAFGVDFLIPVDEYLKTDRATKYAFLVIFLTFIVFFIIQNVGKVQMHPFQYFLIGIALVIFYTLLVAISEHSNFNLSYIISAFATILLITLYSKAILNSKKFTLYIFSVLTALYSYIFVIIQLKDYALLAGSIGLFVILAMIMYFSRKIKW